MSRQLIKRERDLEDALEEMEPILEHGVTNQPPLQALPQCWIGSDEVKYGWEMRGRGVEL